MRATNKPRRILVVIAALIAATVTTVAVFAPAPADGTLAKKSPYEHGG
ncbi:hypothetical protein GCM10009555_078820 [Acrocarpospora macrocephala]|uniref:Uncharacterized protein n=1 Tax=Acrocarpospora macrocephala TaxID=150177 RepID=A0A5M3XBL8_9ACTN|nr:hypothetical protein [Acrocarpospora macrocephala]GES16283.1 hypothetical protein Amac_098810 [Acrocarpospora macrocephala]